jgi:hypothetical protein
LNLTVGRELMAAREAPRFCVSVARNWTTRRRKQGRQRQAKGTTRTARMMGKSITTSVVIGVVG